MYLIYQLTIVYAFIPMFITCFNCVKFPDSFLHWLALMFHVQINLLKCFHPTSLVNNYKDL